MGQAQINVRTRACSGTFIARTKQAALTHNVRGKRLNLPSYSYFLCFYAANFATIIKTQQISELREFCREYQNVVNVATIICTKFKILQTSNRSKFKNATNFKGFKLLTAVNVPFNSYFCPTFSFCFSTFILIFFSSFILFLALDCQLYRFLSYRVR